MTGKKITYHLRFWDVTIFWKRDETTKYWILSKILQIFRNCNLLSHCSNMFKIFNCQSWSYVFSILYALWPIGTLRICVLFMLSSKHNSALGSQSYSGLQWKQGKFLTLFENSNGNMLLALEIPIVQYLYVKSF